jgi:hypothetical protein
MRVYRTRPALRCGKSKTRPSVQETVMKIKALALTAFSCWLQSLLSSGKDREHRRDAGHWRCVARQAPFSVADRSVGGRAGDIQRSTESTSRGCRTNHDRSKQRTRNRSEPAQIADRESDGLRGNRCVRRWGDSPAALDAFSIQTPDWNAGVGRPGVECCVLRDKAQRTDLAVGGPTVTSMSMTRPRPMVTLRPSVTCPSHRKALNGSALLTLSSATG